MEAPSLEALLDGVSRVAVSGHVRPDGDSVGACLGLLQYIKDYDERIRVDVYLESSPERFAYLPGFSQISRIGEKEIVYDLFLAVDCADPDRLGDALNYLRTAGKTVCIDHHISNAGYGDINYILPEASSACELVYRMLNKEHISKDTAVCLYTGIVTDTGLFQYSCTSPLTMQIAGELMQKGIPYPDLVKKAFFEMTEQELRIKGYAMSNCSTCFDGRCVISIITLKDLALFGADLPDLEGIASELRNLKGVETVVFLHENTDHTYKLSLRSGSDVDVAKIAMKLGGGGHIRAAGATITEPVLQARDRILDMIAEQMN